jgi:broad specificity phosphatase PhoE
MITINTVLDDELIGTICLEFGYDFEKKKIVNAENFEELPALFKRVHPLLDEIKQKEYNNVLIVAHGGILRAIHYYFNEVPKDGDLTSFKIVKREILQYET